MNSNHKTKPERLLNLYFQVHQPRRLGRFSFFDIGSGRDYFDDGLNQQIMKRVASNCYLPANLLLLELIRKYPQIKVTFSISGSALRQFERFAPEVLDSFRVLAATGSIEFLGETYYHSLAYQISPEEFKEQVNLHADKMNKHFGVLPTVFRNTELIYSDGIGLAARSMGFKGIFTDGIERILDARSPNQLYLHPDTELKIFLRNYKLSDDIAFRFLQGNKVLTVQKYLESLELVLQEQSLISLGLDYETFGEHHKSREGIFKFLQELLTTLAKHKQFTMVTPSGAIELMQPQETLRVPDYISWADQERDLSAWLGNDMQRDAFSTLKKLEHTVKQINEPALINTWRYLQTSDHFYYMSTKKNDDGNVHSYFSPYASPYEAFMNYMNILTDFSLKAEAKRTPDMVVTEGGIE